MLFFTTAERETGVKEELSTTNQAQELCEGPAVPVLLEQLDAAEKPQQWEERTRCSFPQLLKDKSAISTFTRGLCCGYEGNCGCCSPAALSTAQSLYHYSERVPLAGEKTRTEVFLRGSRSFSAEDKQEKQGMQYQAGCAGALLPSTNLKGSGSGSDPSASQRRREGSWRVQLSCQGLVALRWAWACLAKKVGGN